MAYTEIKYDLKKITKDEYTQLLTTVFNALKESMTQGQTDYLFIADELDDGGVFESYSANLRLGVKAETQEDASAMLYYLRMAYRNKPFTLLADLKCKYRYCTVNDILEFLYTAVPCCSYKLDSEKIVRVVRSLRGNTRIVQDMSKVKIYDVEELEKYV